MQEKLNVVEIDRRSASVKNESNRAREERMSLQKKIRATLDEKRKNWEEGFVAGLEAAAGLHEKVKFARGTADLEDTAPYPIVDLDIVKVG